jgi:hypothetical protein
MTGGHFGQAEHATQALPGRPTLERRPFAPDADHVAPAPRAAPRAHSGDAFVVEPQVSGLQPLGGELAGEEFPVESFLGRPGLGALGTLPAPAVALGVERGLAPVDGARRGAAPGTRRLGDITGPPADRAPLGHTRRRSQVDPTSPATGRIAVSADRGRHSAGEEFPPRDQTEYPGQRRPPDVSTFESGDRGGFAESRGLRRSAPRGACRTRRRAPGPRADGAARITQTRFWADREASGSAAHRREYRRSQLGAMTEITPSARDRGSRAAETSEVFALRCRPWVLPAPGGPPSCDPTSSLQNLQNSHRLVPQITNGTAI